MIKAVAVLPQGLEAEGAQELLALGATSIELSKRCVIFEADMPCFYRLHFLARLPFRLLRQIAVFSCSDRVSLCQGVKQAFDWRHWLPPSKTFRVDATGSVDGLNHSHFNALQVKNAIIDVQREIWGARSNINLQDPDFCIHLHIRQDQAVLSLDGLGTSFHRRGYRAAMGTAPLKENIAAGLIRLSGWNNSLPLVDPFCGSGTFLIEAASIGLKSPLRLGASFLVKNWLDFDKSLWNQVQSSVIAEKLSNDSLPLLIGCEDNSEIASHAKKNVVSAGLSNAISIETKHFRKLELPNQPGIIICNPPYGKRLGFMQDLGSLYEEFGTYLKQKASGWELWLLSGNPNLTRNLRLKCSYKLPISNGGIDCRWLRYKIN